MLLNRIVPGIEMYDVDTPALLLNQKLLEHNIQTMSGFISGVKANLRPHVKCHRTPLIARKQIESGAKGISCAKISEAEVMIEAGIKDIFVANQIVGENKIARLIRLAENSNISVAVDNLRNARNISRLASKRGLKIDILIEIEIGTNRCGLEPGRVALTLAKKLQNYEGLRIRGLMGYEGFAGSIRDFDKRKEACERALDSLITTKDMLEDAGIESEDISVGTTGTYRISGSYPGVTEIRSGSYALSSARHKVIVPEFEVALTLLTTVISRPTQSRAVIDAGRTAISYDQGFPLIKGVDGVELVRLYDEHGVLEIKNSKVKLDVNDKIELVQTHPCTTVALHDEMFCIDEGKLQGVWDITTRGKFL